MVKKLGLDIKKLGKYRRLHAYKQKLFLKIGLWGFKPKNQNFTLNHGFSTRNPKSSKLTVNYEFVLRKKDMMALKRAD